MSPTISVIIPVYNTALYLPDCLNSVINQSYENIEIICVDDGSTDDSLKIIENFASNDSRFIVLHTDNNGAGAARNAGLDIAKGEWLYFPDSDDRLSLCTLELSLKIAVEKKSDIVQFKYVEDSDETIINELCATLDSDTVKTYTPRNVPDFFNTLVGRVNTKLFRKKTVVDNNIRFQEISSRNDTFFCFASCLVSKRISIIDMPLYAYTVRDDSISHKAAVSIDNDFAALKALKDYMEVRKIYSEYEHDFINMVIPEVIDYALPKIDPKYYAENAVKFRDIWIKEFKLDEKNKNFFNYGYYYALIEIFRDFYPEQPGGFNRMIQNYARKCEACDYVDKPESKEKHKIIRFFSNL